LTTFLLVAVLKTQTKTNKLHAPTLQIFPAH